jgi:hypothetical protein
LGGELEGLLPERAGEQLERSVVAVLAVLGLRIRERDLGLRRPRSIQRNRPVHGVLLRETLEAIEQVGHPGVLGGRKIGAADLVLLAIALLGMVTSRYL